MRAAVETTKSVSADCHNSVATVLRGQISIKNVATMLNNVATYLEQKSEKHVAKIEIMS